ncbi:MAG: 4Fe-4S binding protein [Oscillospiraceae bacterium]|nr:4Fe-4S binding protein [Oscillospiraceae bacterium]
MREHIIETAKKYGADLVGFAPASRFPADHKIFRIFPETKTVICLGFRILRGAYRGIEEGSTYYQYTTMGVENMEEVVMPAASLQVSLVLEEEGYLGIPQRRHQTVMEEEGSTNPEVAYNLICRGVKAEPQFDFTEAAVLCGLGEKGFHGALLTDEFGPMIRTCFVLTDAGIEASPVKEPHLCDNCGECAAACPGHAIDADGKLDPWQCAVYYNGANGTRNPFMPPDAFADLDDRLAIIAGEAQVTPEKAKEILDRIIFYPPAKHSYQTSVCGRACDLACYIRLEEKGVLTRKFKTPFRKREPWRFDLKDFE